MKDNVSEIPHQDPITGSDILEKNKSIVEKDDLSEVSEKNKVDNIKDEELKNASNDISFQKESKPLK